jgi:hypothetical protein
VKVDLTEVVKRTYQHFCFFTLPKERSTRADDSLGPCNKCLRANRKLNLVSFDFFYIDLVKLYCLTSREAICFDICVDAFPEPTIMRRSFLQHLHVGWSDRCRGRLDRGRRVHRRETNERSSAWDPVRAGAPWFVLGSTSQLGRPRMPRR